MNNILQKLELEPGVFRKENQFRGGLIAYTDIAETGNTKPVFGGMPQREFSIKLTIGMKFFSNDVMLEQSLKVAERSLMTYLYGDTLNLLQRAEQAVFDGDAETTLATIATIRKNLTGGS